MTVKKEKIMEWKRLSATLKTVKTQEMELRKEIAKEVLKGHIGTKNEVIGTYKVKAQQSERQKVDNEALLSIWNDLTQAEKEVIQWKPEVIVSKYKALIKSDAPKDKLLSVIETVKNAPTLKVEIVKA